VGDYSDNGVSKRLPMDNARGPLAASEWVGCNETQASLEHVSDTSSSCVCQDCGGDGLAYTSASPAGHPEADRCPGCDGTGRVGSATPDRVPCRCPLCGMMNRG
jgi:hypothetical protein